MSLTSRCCLALAVAQTALPQAVEFNRDIRPILSDKCSTCHGPDQANRKSKLRLDTESGAFADLGGHKAIVPGNAAASELIKRVSSTNKATRMPPAYTGAAALSDRDIALLTKWVEQGAVWQKHWSFIAPKRPAGTLDSIVRARLERDGLKPSPEADRATLLRRVSLDLTGLPPLPAEVEAFTKDASANAYEQAVDRLLASPRYGERMAVRWLDAARYADTNGYQTDAERFMWRWRDWVINAFNANKPFDQFTIEQIAGDLLPNATLDQRIATGFNRNHRGNGEGGIIAEEYATEYVVDRVETTSTVWLGLTLGCARCHDHKYDPFSQKEFYQVFAYFNNIPEKGKAFKYGNSPPFVKAPTPGEAGSLAMLEKHAAAARRAFEALKPEADKAQRAWERAAPASADWVVEASSLEKRIPIADTKFDGKRSLEAGKIGNLGFYDRFTLDARIKPESPDGMILGRIQDVSEGSGYGIFLNNGKVGVSMCVRWLDDGFRAETAQPLDLNRWHQVTMTYDGSRTAEGVKIYVNGAEQKLTVLLDDLNQSFEAPAEPLRVGAGLGLRFKGEIASASIYKRALTAPQAAILAEQATLAEIAATASERRTRVQQDKLDLAFLDQYAPDAVRKAWADYVQARRIRDQFEDSISTVMVMQEKPAPAETHLLLRGAYDRPGPAVSRAVPASLPPMPAGLPSNRLGLAKWIADPANPLTARVAVNRFWQMFFGTGIVKTVEDFGAQGEWPSNIELLDWLATEFTGNGWNVKALLKTIVMSDTYRQSSKASPELLQRDPENRLLARGPRVRLSAEVVRDQALAVSGLLVEKTGGPSVKPYQPAGLWKELSGGADYQPDTGESLYRRSLYTFWKRASPPPFMMNFDSAGRETCTVRENRTNTPLQALNLMNDVTYVEASRALAEQMMRHASPEAAIRHGFLAATARAPKAKEAAILLSSYRHYKDLYSTTPDAAAKLLAEGQRKPDPALDPRDLAAYTMVASLILNLDEVVSKE